MIIIPKNGAAKPYIIYKFDEGSLSSWTKIDATPTIRITPKKHWNNYWAWWAIRSRKWAGKTPVFLIAKANHYNITVSEWLACWSTSPDSDTWTKFDNISIGASDIQFSHNTAFPSGTVYIAALPMYPLSRTQRKIAEWAQNSLVGETPSTANKVFGNATIRDNGDGRIVPALPFYGLKVANATINTKNASILTAGNHPSETPGNYILEGALDWLLTSGVRQKFLLDWFNFYVYPSLNPQGRWGGWFRSDPQNPTQDHNRLWNGSGVDEAVDAFKAAWNTDFSNTIEVGLDFHSWMEADGNRAVTIDHTTALWTAYAAILLNLDPAFSMRSDDATASMLANYWNSLGAKLSGSIDHGHITSLGPAQWKQAGANVMIGLANMLTRGYWTNGPGIGSRDFNGATDRIDWANIANLSGSPFTVSGWVNVDVANVINDYLLCMHDAGDTSFGIAVNFITNIAFDLVKKSSGGQWIWYLAYNITSGGWHHVLATCDGGHTAGSVTMYIDGLQRTVYFTDATGTETAHTGSWSIGGRIPDDIRNFDGKIAQVGVWNRVLNTTEIANLAAGYSPGLISSDLLFCFKGNTSSLVASRPDQPQELLIDFLVLLQF